LSFRLVRFVSNEPHGRGQAIQVNYFLDHGAFRVNADGTFTVDATKIRQAVVDLTREIMTLQAEGSYVKAQAMLEKLGVIRPEVQRVLDSVADIPIDIEPRFTTAEQLVRALR
jgi:hypothetical protein